ncbi:MAG TPA: SCO family protein [Ktedonobacterales bacterium]|nr:SCO family protein [Ktedonobacterales bacterium]
MSWRLASRLSVLLSAILVIIVIVIVTHSPSSSQAAPLQGTDLGSVSAPDFRLADQFGNPISLSQFRGHPVVLTFLYTRCPDTCPLIADKLHLALSKMGSDSSEVGVLAVSTDPQNDTTQAAYQFSQTHHLLNQWHFLVGTHATLAPIWSEYSVYAANTTPTATDNNTVDHTVAIYLIDKQGHERVYLGEDFDPNVLASDLQTLLKQ